LKTQFDKYVKWIFNHVIKPNRDKAWLMSVEESCKPLFCSNKDMKSSECRILAGYQMYRSLQGEMPKEVYDRYETLPINKDGSYNTKYTYITVVKDFSKETPKMEVIKLNTTNKNAAMQKHKELVEYKLKDSMKVGFMVHSSFKYFGYPKTRIPGVNSNDFVRNNDVHELIGEWSQSKFKGYEEAEASEKALDLKTNSERQSEIKKLIEKISGLFKGTGEKTITTEYYYLTRLYKNRLQQTYSVGTPSMKYAFSQLMKMTTNYYYRPITRMERHSQVLWHGR